MRQFCLQQHYSLHAGLDCSDGLSKDLWRICQASGCGAVVETACVPIADAAHELARQLSDDVSPLQHALSDGEDFELILAVPPAAAKHMLAAQPLLPVHLTEIGFFIAEHKLSERDAQGIERPLPPQGYEH